MDVDRQSLKPTAKKLNLTPTEYNLLMFNLPVRPANAWTIRIPLATSAGWLVIPLALIAMVAAPVSGQSRVGNRLRQWQKPNIIVLNLDDADTDLLSANLIDKNFPNLGAFAKQGIRFTNLHVVNPLCGPSRACFLRGQYSHRTDVMVNQPSNAVSNGMPGGFTHYLNQGFFEDDLSTWMQDAGYHTMLVGKFLHGEFQPIVPPGWDDFYSSTGDRYYGAHRFTNRDHPEGRGETMPNDVFRTSAEFEDAIALINEHQSTRPLQPFFLYLNPINPHVHSGAEDDQMYEDQFANLWNGSHLDRTPDFNELDNSDKNGPLNQIPLLSGAAEDRMDRLHRDRHRSTKSVDELFGGLMQELEQLGIDQNTFVFVTSDNGYSLGHHRHLGKSLAMNRLTNVPLIARGPGIPQQSSAPHLLAHIDLTATIVDLAGGTLAGFVDGQSFRPLLFQPNRYRPQTWREPILIEGFIDLRPIGVPTPLPGAYSAVRTYDQVYIEYASGEREYYNLKVDPWQLENRIGSLSKTQQESFRGMIDGLRQDLVRPKATLGFPHLPDTVLPRQAVLKGLAMANRIDSVQLQIRDTVNQRFWNGSHWQNEPAILSPNLTHPAGHLSNWSYALDVPASDVPHGNVEVTVSAVDNRGVVSSPTQRSLTLDYLPPEIIIEFPESREAEFTSTAYLSGHSADQVGVVEVRCVVIDRSTGLFWDGVQFRNSWVAIPAEAYPDGSWEFKTSPPVGDYVVSVQGVDSSGNATVSVPWRLITIH